MILTTRFTMIIFQSGVAKLPVTTTLRLLHPLTLGNNWTRLSRNVSRRGAMSVTACRKITGHDMPGFCPL